VQVLEVTPRTEMVNPSVNVANSGGEDIELLTELPACGCAEIEPLQTRLRPGESVNIRVQIPIDHWIKEWGFRLILLTLKCNDPRWPRISLGFQVNLRNQ